MSSVVKRLVEALEKVKELARSYYTDNAIDRVVPRLIAESGAASLPTTVCLCGSTRFKDAFVEANRTETLAGNIVLSVGMFGHSDPALMKPCPNCKDWPEYVKEGNHCQTCKGTCKVFDQDSPVKKMLDELHRRKIDMADEVLVLNVGGYIGESTLGEIRYARARGTPIRYLEPQYEEPV